MLWSTQMKTHFTKQEWIGLNGGTCNKELVITTVNRRLNGVGAICEMNVTFDSDFQTEKDWDAKMAEFKEDDLISKVQALDSLEALIDRNDVKTIKDVKLIMKQYRAVLSVQLKGEIDE